MIIKSLVIFVIMKGSFYQGSESLFSDGTIKMNDKKCNYHTVCMYHTLFVWIVLYPFTGVTTFLCQAFHQIKIVPKLQKATDRDPELISSEGGQDTSVCKISGHSLHVFSKKCPKPPNLTRFTKSK